MPNYFDPSMLRFKSIYNQSNPSFPLPLGDVNAPRTNVRQDALNDGAPEKDTIGQDDEITKIVNKLYTPGHEIADKFNEVWNQMPQREKPSVLRRIVASMVGGGGGGIKGADEVIDAPYNEARSEWLDKLKMLQPLLGEERASNINERQLATSAATQTIQNRRAAETERHNREAEIANQQNIKIREERAKAYIYKQNNPNHVLKEDEEGNLIGINPADNSMQYIVDDDGNKIKSGRLSDADKINLQVQGRIAAARVTGEENRKTENVRQSGRIAVTKERGAQQAKVKSISSGQGSEGTETTTKTTVTDAQGKPIGTREVTQVKKPLGKVPPGMVRMKSPDGKTIKDIPINMKDHYLKLGAKEVKE